ncbi:MAG: carboxypeptidase-like regulatory domain-containing protein, partial [Elusimicrobiota bacterium]
DANGQFAFDTAASPATLHDGLEYHVFASSQGYFPALREQVFNPAHARAFIASGDAKTVALKIGKDAERPGAMAQFPLSSGTASGVVGCMFIKEGIEHELAFGLAGLDPTGAGVCNIHNLPIETALAVFEAKAFDVTKGVEISTDTSHITINGVASSPANGKITISAGDVVAFDSMNLASDNALPPETVKAETNQESAAAGADYQSVSNVEVVDGVVLSTDTTNPIYIPWAGVSLKKQDPNCQAGTRCNFWHVAWTNTDQNGRFKFFNLPSTGTYFTEVSPGCAWGQQNNVCFVGYSNTTLSSTGPYVATANDIVYTGAPINGKRIKVNRSASGNLRMRVAVRNSEGRSIPGSMISVEPDFSSWHSTMPYNLQKWNCGQNGCQVEVTTHTSLCEGWQWNQQNSTWTLTSSDRPWHNYWDQSQQREVKIDEWNPGLNRVNLPASTGYVVIDSLLPGNYQIRAFAQFTGKDTMYNNGPDGETGWDGHKGCTSKTYDDLRVTVSSIANANGDNVYVYDASGTYKSHGSSITIVIDTIGTKARRLRGQLKFAKPSDFSGGPITMIMRRDCQNNQSNDCWRHGGFAVVGDQEAHNGQTSIDYEIWVSTGGSYWLEINTNFWGRVYDDHGGEEKYDLSVATEIVKNFSFAPAGRLVGKVYKPDGSLFKAGDTQDGHVNGNVNAGGENGWGWGQVREDGAYVLGGLFPGHYQISAEARMWKNNGGGDVTLPYTLPGSGYEADVVANQDTSMDIKFADGMMMVFKVNPARLPALDAQISQWGELRGDRFAGMMFPAGIVFNPPTIAKMMFGETSWLSEIQQRITDDPNKQWCKGGLRAVDGWCPAMLPMNSVFDFYLMRKGDIDGGKEGGQHVASNAPYMFLTVVNSTVSIAINNVTSQRTSTFTMVTQGGDAMKQVVVNLSPIATVSRGVTLFGLVTASNLIRQEDFKKMTNFEDFVKYLPIVSVFDSDKKFMAAGVVTPPPQKIEGDIEVEAVPDGKDDFEEAIQNQDWTLFQLVMSSMAGWGLGYEIRGLPTGKNIMVMANTPNYPPLTQTIALDSVVGSTTTFNINFDGAGKGAAIWGVVTDTATTPSPLANAAINVIGGIYTSGDNDAVTDSSGAYKLFGVPAGGYIVEASASGHFKARRGVSISSAASYLGEVSTVSFRLEPAGSASIWGSVYTRGLYAVSYVPNVTVYLLDETYRAANSTASLTLQSKVTSSTGVYRFEGLKSGNSYKLFVREAGKYVINVTT